MAIFAALTGLLGFTFTASGRPHRSTTEMATDRTIESPTLERLQTPKIYKIFGVLGKTASVESKGSLGFPGLANGAPESR